MNKLESLDTTRNHRMIDIFPKEISLVDRGANLKRHLIVKREKIMENEMETNANETIGKLTETIENFSKELKENMNKENFSKELNEKLDRISEQLLKISESKNSQETESVTVQKQENPVVIENKPIESAITEDFISKIVDAVKEEFSKKLEALENKMNVGVSKSMTTEKVEVKKEEDLWNGLF